MQPRFECLNFNVSCRTFVTGPKIWVRTRDRIQKRFRNYSILQASHYHVSFQSRPMSYTLYLKRTRRAKSLESSLVWNSKLVLVFKFVLVVQFKLARSLLTAPPINGQFILYSIWQLWRKIPIYVCKFNKTFLHHTVSLNINNNNSFQSIIIIF